MFNLVPRLDNWFDEQLHGLKYNANTKAYIVGVLSKFDCSNDMSNQSIVIAFHDAKINGDFVRFQKIGDWVLWADIFNPEYIHDNKEIIQTIGRMSYYTCHRILQKQWRVYEELADELPSLTTQVRSCLGLHRQK